MVLNLVDFAIIGVIVISILYALHGGFLNSLFNTFAMLLSCGIALLFTPSLASSFKENEAVMSALLHYTEGASRIDNLELARSSVSSLSPDTLQQAVQNARFPHPFDQLLLENMQTLSLQSQDCVTLADYFNQTLVNVSLNILCFVLLFLVAFLLIACGCACCWR